MQTHPLGPLHPLAAFRQFIPVRLVPLAGTDRARVDAVLAGTGCEAALATS